MSHDWSPESLAPLTAAVLARHVEQDAEDARWACRGIEVDGTDLLVGFTYRDHSTPYVVRVDAGRAPEGPSTGEWCETPEQWAVEVLWRLDEEVSTRWVEQATRTTRADGTVELGWR